MVDTEVIKKILCSLDEGLEHLKSKKDVSWEEYQKDKDIQAIVERRLETTIQACIDIGNHTISQEGMGTPNDYGEIFTILAQNGIIENKEAETMIKMVGFRNVLIHEYREILTKRVYDILQNRLGDFNTFAKRIIEYLNKS